MFNDQDFFTQAIRASRLAYDLKHQPHKPKQQPERTHQPRTYSRLYTQQQINDYWFIRDLADITKQKHPDCQAPDCHNPKHLKNLCRKHYNVTLHFKAVY